MPRRSLVLILTRTRTRTRACRLAVAAALSTAMLPLCAATLQLAPGQSLADALRRAADGDVIELAAGDYRGQVGVIEQRRLTLRGVGGRAVLHADGRDAEGKATLVVRGSDVVVENLGFRGARVADGNGAGIRLERGRLTVLNCAFIDNQMGVLTSNAADSELVVRDSEFAQAPPGGQLGRLTHLLYVGSIARFTLSGSKFSGGATGHLVKSRARVSEVRDNRLVDGPGGRAAYELEFPNGGEVTVVGNTIGQSAGTSNPVLVSFGIEGYSAGPQRLELRDNTLVNDASPAAVFVRVRESTPPVLLRVQGNRLYGPGDPGAALPGDDNRQLPLSALPALPPQRP